MKKRLLSVITLGLSIVSYGQVSEGGLPTTFAKVIQGEVSEFNTNYQIVELNAPDMQTVYAEDQVMQEKHQGYRVSILEPVSLSIQNSGTWQVLDNGDKIWRLGVKMENAAALSLYFSEDVVIPEGGKLHAYNENHSQYVGAFTSNTQTFQSMEMIEGGLLTLEYYMPASSTQLPTINIGDVAYYYRGVDDRVAAFRDGFSTESQTRAQSCEVDVACSEITGWTSQRDAAVHYSFVVGGSGYVCSGSMVNNTANDCKAYFLTANHCGEPTTNANITQHTFYFNYQRPTCSPNNTSVYNGAQSQTISGGTLKASSELGNQTAGTNQVSGSDFLLIELSTSVPTAFNPYYAGWDRSTSGSGSGVGIHHPAGHEKKISTYNSTLSSATYNGGWSNAHWEVQWVATTNGHGVTEGGSSGSPIFNNSGLIVGFLSGGSSYCTSPNSTDLYGKITKAWDQEGGNANQQLKAWLDPTNSGTMSLSGTYAPCSPSAPVADFVASAVSVTPGTAVTLTDLSSNTPTSWAWTVSPGTGWTYTSGNATSQNPEITFNTLGLHTVTLTATNAIGNDTETKTDYINVTATANPCVATSTHSCGNDDVFISNVTLNTIDNNSNCSNYTDFTAQSTTLTQGTAYDVTVWPTVQGSAGSAYTDDEMAVWIDWNNDADFDDTGEQVGYVLVGNGWSNVFNFTVPASATIGNLKMRVRMSYQPIDGPIAPCGTTEYGETEDYTVTIQGGSTVTAPVAQFTANQTTAPQNSTISFTDQSTNAPTSWNWSVSPASGWTYANGTNTASQHPQMNFTDAGTYTVTLTASNSAGSDSEVKSSYITITDINGVEESELSNISIYPNPTNSVVYVNLKEINVLSVMITDVTGRIITQDFNPSGLIEFELSDESKGVYFVKINSENNSITQKVVKH